MNLLHMYNSQFPRDFASVNLTKQSVLARGQSLMIVYSFTNGQCGKDYTFTYHKHGTMSTLI